MCTNRCSSAPKTPRPAPARGSALITVILVALVLTVVGLGIAYFASTEDKISGNVEMSRTGFYAAEAGLRAAEVQVSAYTFARNGDGTDLIKGPFSTAETYNPPGGGHPAYILKIAGFNFKNVVIPSVLGNASRRAMYTAYVRNNEEDNGGGTKQSDGDHVDTDKRLNIVVVGQMVLVDASGNPILDGNGVPTIGITRILEEQLQTNPEGSATATQKDANVGGTGAGAK